MLNPKRVCKSRFLEYFRGIVDGRRALRHKPGAEPVTFFDPWTSTRGPYCAATGGALASGCGLGAALGGRRDGFAGGFTAARLTGAGGRFGFGALFGAATGFALRAALFFTTGFGAAASRAAFAAAALAPRTAAHRLLCAAAIRLRAPALTARLALSGAAGVADLPPNLCRRSAMRASISLIFSW